MSDAPEDLLARARRELLGETEQRELARCLEGSLALRTAAEVGQDFDRLAAVRPGDEYLVERFVSGALRHRGQLKRKSRAPRRALTWLVAAAFLVSATAALGYWTGQGPWRAPEPADPVAEAAERAARARRARAARPVAPEPAAALPAPAPQAPASSGPPKAAAANMEPAAEEPARSASSSALKAEAPADTPSSLFAEASAARRSGRQREAAALFHRLENEFPASREATLAYLSLGRLLLAQGRADAALSQFTGYLKRGGPLAEEALLGRGRALRSLGRRDEERAAWRALLARFPNSVYAVEARSRLQAEPRAGARSERDDAGR